MAGPAHATSPATASARRPAPLALAATLAALALVGCGGKARTYEEAMGLARKALASGANARAFDACRRAFDLAEDRGGGNGVVEALDCAAEAAQRDARPWDALPLYERTLERHDEVLRRSRSRYRLRNNHGVALYVRGRPEEAMRVLERTLDAWPGSPASSRAYGNYRARMRVVTNLAHLAREAPSSEVAARLSGEIAGEVEAAVADAGRNVGAVLGAGEALQAIAAVLRRRGDGERAAALAALGQEQQAAEDEYTDLRPALRRECEVVAASGGQVEGCFRKIP